eukprot:scaffold3046_cov51-Attheya_sp.AAC.2
MGCGSSKEAEAEVYHSGKVPTADEAWGSFTNRNNTKTFEEPKSDRELAGADEPIPEDDDEDDYDAPAPKEEMGTVAEPQDDDELEQSA